MAKLSERVTSHYENLRLQDDSDEVRAQHAQSLMALCQSFAKIRDFDRAARLANEVVQIRGDVYGPEDPSIAEALLEAGRARDQMSDYATAEASFERGIKALEAKRAGQEQVLVALYGSRGELCRHLGRYAEARHWEGQALALSDQLGNPAPLEYARRLNDLGELCRNMKELDQADHFLTDARAKAEALTEPDQGLRGEITGNLGVLRYDQKRYPEADDLLQKALEMDKKALGDGHPIVAADRYKLARVAIATGKLTDAADLVTAAERVLDDPAGRQKARLAKCLEVKADLLLARKDLAAAEQAARRVLDIRTALFKPPHPDLVHTYEQLAEVLTAQNRAEDAGRAKQSAEEMRSQIKARDDEVLGRLKKS
jgi:tetratricopeptide (TPR) repeat protein